MVGEAASARDRPSRTHRAGASERKGRRQERRRHRETWAKTQGQIKKPDESEAGRQGEKAEAQKQTEAQLGRRNQTRKRGKNNETWVQILTSLGFSLLNSETKERISSCWVC